MKRLLLAVACSLAMSSQVNADVYVYKAKDCELIFRNIPSEVMQKPVKDLTVKEFIDVYDVFVKYHDEQDLFTKIKCYFVDILSRKTAPSGHPDPEGPNIPPSFRKPIPPPPY